MSRRKSFGIPLSIPIDDQLSDINKQLALLKARIDRPIDLGNAFVPSMIECPEMIRNFQGAQAQCAHASQCLRDPKRELIFALTDSIKPNGLAMSCATFDAVLLTQGFFDKLYFLTVESTRVLFEDNLYYSLSGTSFRQDFFSSFSEHDHDAKKDFIRLIHHSALSFILGHEFGHLASGHFGWAKSPEELDIHHGGLAAANHSLSHIDLLSQAMEVDADMYGGSWAENLLMVQLSVEKEQTRIGRLVKWVQGDPCRVTFVLTLSSLLAYSTLGVSEFALQDIYAAKTHPQTSLRARLAADTMMVNNYMRNHGNVDRHASCAREALSLIGLGVASNFMRHLESNSDPDAVEILRQMKAESALDLTEKTARVMGLYPPSPGRRAELDKYLAELSALWNKTKASMAVNARWKPEYRVKWSAGTALPV